MVGILCVQIAQHPNVVRVSPCVWHIAMPHLAHFVRVDLGKMCAIPCYRCHIVAYVRLLILTHKSHNVPYLFSQTTLDRFCGQQLVRSSEPTEKCDVLLLLHSVLATLLPRNLLSPLFSKCGDVPKFAKY